MKLRSVPKDGKLNPLLALESRPSQFTGISYWLVLTYYDHQFDEMLPPDFMGLEQEKRDELVAAAAERLRAKLRPILEAEDAAGA